MFKFLLTSAFCLMVLAFAPAAFATDSSSTHSTFIQDQMLSPWGK